MKKTMTISEYAKHRNVNQPAASKWKAKGLLIMRGSKVDVAASDAVLDGIEKGPPDGREPKNRAEAQFLKDLYDGKLRRQQYLEREGKLIDRNRERKDLFDIHRLFRDELQNIPVRLSPGLALESDQRKIEAILAKEIAEVLNALAKKLESR